MDILGVKPNHDGGVCLIENGVLKFCLESEKDSHPRHSHLKPADIFRSLSCLARVPEVVAVGGWHFDLVTASFRGPKDASAGYWGVEEYSLGCSSLLGHDIKLFTSTHERSHIFCSYGLSSVRNGTPCYVLVMEGSIGRMYSIDSEMKIRCIAEPMFAPGTRYSFLYYYGSSSELPFRDARHNSGPGKLMALAAFGDAKAVGEEDRVLADYILSQEFVSPKNGVCPNKSLFPMASTIKSIGVEHPRFANLARYFTDELFRRVFHVVKDSIDDRRPLLVGGGCGLNCEWNTEWLTSNLFSDVFVPPCTDDSGSCIGTAVDAQFCLTKNAKVEWSVYAGMDIVDDQIHHPRFQMEELDLGVVARWLKAGFVVAWMQGRCEIGPRALGHRSLLAAPFDCAMTQRLNAIKQREGFRPIAPVCLATEAQEHFSAPHESSFMLFFQKVKNLRLGAVTHVDGSARIQTVCSKQNPVLAALLLAFKEITGVGVLCNTSLNFAGLGFINRTSDALRYAEQRGLEAVVVGNRMYLRRDAA